ncbi:D-erythronate dehydrogenase [Mongoliimonas terrestris]|uniref:D-erythronate dehydrogenase n=1 Tax=Mongoliimonas terrestris TaxID=1709001 RepID=UPI00094955C5|nr:D-erythronate dehydrogenase [Mongoliimonas terrestris]
MQILVTGATGFIGRLVMAELAARTTLQIDGVDQPIDTILAADLDQAALEGLKAADDRVRPLAGPYGDAATIAAIEAAQPGLVIHLASVVSSAAEADYDLGIEVNLAGLVRLVQACRRFAEPPVFVFTSSVAVFSAPGNGALTDDDVPVPRSSYGAQKLMGEILVRDASRRGIVRGRSIRFPTIAVRPGAPNRAASSFVSGIIREPLAGVPARLPVGTETRLHLASPEAALGSILRAAALVQASLGGETTITLPGLSLSVADMIEGLRAVAGDDAVALIQHEPDPAIEAIVLTWPGSIATPRAVSLGFDVDRTFADLVKGHVART